ncbi:MAG: hypothetical protein QOH74_53, partial [Gaiellales bacterium]|nr:hypothetical protein [Gaiellales bacterium]
MEPWGISGPAFVWLFIALLIAPLIVRVFLRASIKRTNGSVTTFARPLSIYQLAYLLGGPKRTVETVIAALVHRGQLRVNSKKKLKAVGVLPVDPLERAVAKSATDAVGSTTTGVMNSVLSSSRLTALATELEDQGLLVPASKRRMVRRTVFFLYVVVFAIGVARWVNAVSLDRPVGLLSAELIVAVIVCVFVATKLAGHEAKAGPHLTSTGAAVLARARSEKAPKPHSRRQAPAGPHKYSQGRPYGALLAGAAGAVALGGLAMYPDPEISQALVHRPIG